jgi:hypothetical protein
VDPLLRHHHRNLFGAWFVVVVVALALAATVMKETKKADGDLITVAAAMTEFGLGRSTIFRAFDSGKLRRHRRGLGDTRVYVSRKALRALVSPKEEQS